MKQRIYLVKGKHDLHLVRGPSRTSALTFVAQKTLTVELADQDTLVSLLGKGYDVHQAREEQPELPLRADDEPDGGVEAGNVAT